MRRNQQLEKIAYEAVINGELQIDENGNIWRLKKRVWNRWLKKTVVVDCKKIRAEKTLPSGYLQIRVMKDLDRVNVSAHRLVYYHFNGEIPIGLTINHRDGIKHNNSPLNLEIMTHSENTIHSRTILKVGNLNQHGSNNNMAKLSNDQVLKIRERRNNGEKLKSIAEDYNVSFQTISKIAKGYRWNEAKIENKL